MSFYIPALETNTRRIRARLEREGWLDAGGGKHDVFKHDVFKHPHKPGQVVIPRHREQSRGVARSIAKAAGWVETTD